uniref:F-box domain-containing protein n=1 Tax=Strongyloides papillosus TaxID=174720 RepID=A0A0N5B5D4_STREA
MDFTIEEEYFEVNDDTPILPDDVLVIILSKLSWKEINIAKHVSRRFYNIINEKYHQLNRRKACCVAIKYDKNNDGHPFHVEMNLYRENSQVVSVAYYTKTTNIKSVGELSSFLKMFDMGNLFDFYVYVADHLDIFGILEGVFKIGSNIKFLDIEELTEKDFGSFQKFIKKFTSVEHLNIGHICAPLTGPGDLYSLLSLSSLNTLESFDIYECNKTKILSSDIVSKLLINNPNLRSLTFGSMNCKFLESTSKEFSTVHQPSRMACKNRDRYIELILCSHGEIEHLSNVIKESLGNLKNIEKFETLRYLGISFFSEVIEIKSHVEDCKKCLRGGHKIKKCLYLCDESAYNGKLNH